MTTVTSRRAGHGRLPHPNWPLTASCPVSPRRSWAMAMRRRAHAYGGEASSRSPPSRPKVVVEIGELHRAGQAPGGARRMRDSQRVELVGLAARPGQQLERLRLNGCEALCTEPLVRHICALDDVVHERECASFHRHRAGDPLQVLGDEMAAPIPLLTMSRVSDRASDRRVHLRNCSRATRRRSSPGVGEMPRGPWLTHRGGLEITPSRIGVNLFGATPIRVRSRD